MTLKFKFLLVVAAAFFLAGINTVGAAEKPTYETPGCPVFILGEGFSYMGEPELNMSTYCAGNNCNILMPKPGTKVRYDLYASGALDREPQEVCLFIRYELIGRRHYWQAPKGNSVVLNDKYYSELFAVLLREKKKDFNVIEDYLVEKGYRAADPGYVGYLLQRNVNVETQLIMLYACNVRTMPKEILEDGKKIEQYLRERFAERIVPM